MQHSPRHHGEHRAAPLVLDLVQVAVADARMRDLNAHITGAYRPAIKGVGRKHARFVKRRITHAVVGGLVAPGRAAEHGGEFRKGDFCGWE